MKFWQDHPRLATLIAVMIGAGAVLFLYLLSSSAGPIRKSDLPAPESTAVTSSDGSASSSQYVTDIEQVDFRQLLVPDPAAGKSVESSLFVDLRGDGQKEALISVRGPGERRPLDWYIFGIVDGKPAKLFERLGVARGKVKVEGPQVTQIEAVYAQGDADCCPSSTKRTYYTWTDGTLGIQKVEALPGA